LENILVKFASLSLVIYISLTLFIYIKQRGFIYYPSKIEEFKELEKVYNIDNLQIKTLLLNRDKDSAVLYFGGNAEAVEYNIPNFSKILKEFDIYFVKYRGYGGSQGNPVEKDLYSDALYIFDDLKKRYKNVSIIGRSLGSSVATYVASKRDIEKLVLVTPFDSLENIAKDIFPIFPISFMLKDKFNSIDRVDSIKCKTLIITAINDKIVKKIYSLNLINKFKKQNIQSITIAKADHNTISLFDLYYKSIDNFLLL